MWEAWDGGQREGEGERERETEILRDIEIDWFM